MLSLNRAYTVGVVLKQHAHEGLAMLQTLQQHYPQVCFVSEQLEHPIHGCIPKHATDFEENLDLLLVLGGDGTLIHGASLLQNRVVPILGVNLGTIGFLTEIHIDELIDLFPKALQQELPYRDRMRLDASIITQDHQVQVSRRILNDAIVSLQALARIATYRIERDGELVTLVRGDGVIMATPTGSTAYAMAAGGSVISPWLEAVAITPICPHQLTQRQLIIRPQGEFTITLESDSVAFATLDGQIGRNIHQGDYLKITRAPVSTRILTVPSRSYFHTLRTKLNWGS